MKSLKIIIAGGSGFIGQAMAEKWCQNNEVITLTRDINSINNSYNKNHLDNVEYLHWDGKTIGDWRSAIDGCDLLINLAGKSVNCRYTAANKREILESRVNATQVLGEAIRLCEAPPKLWINGGSATIYPSANNAARDESFMDFKDDFSVQVCKSWEASFNEIDLPKTKKVILRMAIVLGNGGVMVPYKRLVKLGLGGKQGSGNQMFSWIHIDDLCTIVEWLWQRQELSGTLNAAAPGPVTNASFMKELRAACNINFGIPASEFLLKIGAAIIGTEPELLLKSRWVLPSRLLKSGFIFNYPGLAEALAHL